MSDETPSHKSWLEKLTHALMREPHDRGELLEVLQDARGRQLLDDDAFRMMQGVLQVSEMKVRDVMVPRPHMVVIDEDASPQEVVPQIIESQHSRFPVIAESRDKIVGILLAKDLLPHQLPHNESSHLRIRDIARPATFIPESKRLDVLLNDFRKNRMHMAIVIDEYGGVSGLITIEDVLEQIVGDIEDEYDIESAEQAIHKIDDRHYTVNALTEIDDFNKVFHTDISDEDFDTIGGFLLQRFSHLPKAGESLKYQHLKITVTHAGNREIQTLRVTLLKTKPKEIK